MDQALDATAYIHEGFWRDLSKDSTHNLILTLCPTRSVILTNALALFVAMSGGQLWTIIRFTLHQIRATTRPENASKIHNQQQVILRNATTDIAAARLMLYLAWSCRKNAKTAVITCITILTLAIFNASFFMVAGTFSNSLVNAGTIVLSRSPFCGVWNETYFEIAGLGNNLENLGTLSQSTEFASTDYSEVQLNMDYARDCYANQTNSQWGSSCRTFAKPKLNWTTEMSDSCPFAAEICSHDADTITFDTGYIDSHFDLGINAAVKDRLKYRRVNHCTVLNDTAFTTSFSSQNDIAGTDVQYQVAYANYGTSLLRNTNYTYSYSNFADFYTEFSGQGTTPYQIGTAFNYGLIPDVSQRSESTFEPVSQLSVEDADVGLLFLGFTGKYTQPVDDPWFSAHVPAGISDSPLEILQSMYTPDRAISTIGCTEQHQFCTSSMHCTPLLGYDQVQTFMTERWSLSPNQNVTEDRIIRAATRSGVLNIVQEIAKTSSPVMAINNSVTASFTLSLRLPNDQWQLELDRWFSIAMARIQRTVVEYATGQIAPRTEYLVPPQTKSESWLCQNQRINSTVYQSFDFVSLIVIVVFGVLIILFSLRIEGLASWVQRRWNIGGRGIAMWNDHDMLGRQRWRKMYETPQASMYGNSPVVQMQTPFRNTELGYLHTQFPASGYYSQYRPTSHSTKRASSQALSPGDSTRIFTENGGRPTPPQSAPSPLRSAITADFVFDFGSQQGSPSPPCSEYPIEKKADQKPLPQVPSDEKSFAIERGLICPLERDITDEKKEVAVPEPAVVEADPAVGTGPGGPGRWAYYSAHKRRYGPRLAVPASHVQSSPHVMTSNMGGLRGDFGSHREGNWI